MATNDQGCSFQSIKQLKLRLMYRFTYFRRLNQWLTIHFTHAFLTRMLRGPLFLMLWRRIRQRKSSLFRCPAVINVNNYRLCCVMENTEI